LAFIENSLYHNQKIIDIINMKAGRQKYFSSKIQAIDMQKQVVRFLHNNQKSNENEFKNSKKSGNKHHYNNFYLR
jgi:hypothetical protein